METRALQKDLQMRKHTGISTREITPYLGATTLLYFTLVGVVLWIGDEGRYSWAQPPDSLEPNKVTIYFLSGVLVFILALIVDVMGWMHTANPLKKKLYTVITFTNLVTGWTYLAFLFNVGPIWTNFAGRPMRPLLYLEWCATTPSLIFLCSQLSSVPRLRVIGVMTADVLMILIGLLSVLDSHYHPILYAISLALGVPTLWGLHHFFTKAIDNIAVKSDIKGMKTLRSITLMVWCVFPVVYQASNTNIISPSTESLMYTILDVNAKAIYSAILLGHNFFSIDQIEALEVLSAKKRRSSKQALTDPNYLLDNLEDLNDRSESMNQLIMTTKQEVEKTKELQVAFLTGVLCFCTFVMVTFYAPLLYEMFLATQRTPSFD